MGPSFAAHQLLAVQPPCAASLCKPAAACNIADAPGCVDLCASYNTLLFAYGQTGCGKTHTFMGPTESLHTVNHPDWGLFPRACGYVFSEMESRGSDCVWTLSCTAIEFYMTG